MKVDVRDLGTFNRLAHEGAEHAVASLGQLTAAEPSVDSTRITVVSREDVGDDLGEFVGVEIGFDGGLCGQTVLAVERDGVDALLAALPGADPESPGERRGQIEEVGNILLGGFLDGWADYLETAIDLSPPTYVEGSDGDVLPERAPAWTDHDQVFTFSSRLESDPDVLTARIYLFPDYDSFTRLAAAGTAGEDVPIPLEQLAVFKRMTTRGAENASANITTMTGMDTTVEVSGLSFVPVEQIPRAVGDREYVGTVFELDGMPSGVLAILFDDDSARAIAGELVPAGDGGFTEMHRSAICEIGNIMTSGFVDGWANVLGTSIEHTPPEFVRDMGRAILDPIAVRLGKSREYAFVVDSTIHTADRRVRCELLAIPDERELTRALDALSGSAPATPPSAGNAEVTHDEP